MISSSAQRTKPLSAALNMTLGQLYTNGIINTALVNAFNSTPRELFVPATLAKSCYVDEELPLGNGRYLLAPLTFAQMIQHAAISEEDSVLIIGSLYGYSAALLAMLAEHVTALETDLVMRTHAQRTIEQLGIINAIFPSVSSFTEGSPSHAPYHAILIEGAVECIPDSLFAQLTENGRLIAIRRVASSATAPGGLGRMTLFRKEQGQIFERELHTANVPLLAGFTHSRQEFRFE